MDLGIKKKHTTAYETIANALAEKKQVYLILRYVTKVYDKEQHNGLRYNLLRLGLCDIMEKSLSNFSGKRKAKIYFGRVQQRQT